MGIGEAIAQYRLVALDTSPFIYLFEKHPKYFEAVQPLFLRLDSDANFRVITSVVTLIELCVLPLRQNRYDLVETYTNALLSSPKVSTFSVDPTIARKSSELRARYGMRTPNAIQVATSLIAGAQAFITNDASLKRVSEIPILVLSDPIE